MAAILTNRFKKILLNRVFHHLIFWMVIFSGFFIFNRPDKFKVISDFNLLIFCLLLPVPVYLNFFLIEKYLNKKKYYLYVLLMLMVIFISAIFVRSLFSENVQAKNGLFSFTVIMIIFLIITTGLKFVKGNLNQKILIQQQKTIQLQAEMEMIKSRINPGFLMIILNHLYQLSLKKSAQVSPLILQFSQMLRHTIDSSRKDHIVLSEELDYIIDYLDLEKQLNGHQIKIKTEGSLKKKISPLILSSLVEKLLTEVNSRSAKPISGEIQLRANKKEILFSIRIDKSHDLKYLPIDLNGLRKGMSLLLTNPHILTQQEDENSIITLIRIFGGNSDTDNLGEQLRG